MTISKRPSDKTRKDAKEIYELSVRMKRIFGKSRLELVLTVFEENHRECFVYETFLESLICYLREKYQVQTGPFHVEDQVLDVANPALLCHKEPLQNTPK